jgi:hypothetical protein
MAVPPLLSVCAVADIIGKPEGFAVTYLYIFRPMKEYPWITAIPSAEDGAELLLVH